MPRSRRCVAALCLVGLLAAQASWGRAPKGPVVPSWRSATIGQALTFFAQRLGLPAAWFKEGWMVDPFGRCGGKALPTSDSGCQLDLSGQCAPNSLADNGCTIDPYGRCLSGH